MEEKINSKLLLIGVFSMLITWLFTVFVIYQAVDTRIENDIKTSTRAIEVAYEQMDNEKDFKELSIKQLRITIINSNGTVIFENTAKGEIKNHLSRPEISSAIINGDGEDTRTSETLGYKSYYYATKLSDGNILRVSTNIDTLYSAFGKAIPIFLGIGLFILFISIVIAKKLTKNIMKPIEDMGENIDNIEEKVPYKELEPFAKAISRQQSKKRENEKIRQEFTANVSHELKTPLTSISGYAEMIETGIAKDEDIKCFAGKIHSEAGRLINLIGDIIKLSELDEPIDKIRTFEKVNLYDIAIEIKNLLDFNANHSQISILVEGEENCVVFGDRSMLSELVYNLCDNAIKYNKPGGNVKICLSNENDIVSLSVTDTGIGIPTEYQERIFERFYRVDKSRSKQTGGTGLGLAIVKHVSLNHNANISIHSEIDKGTQVCVVFNE
ncbi:MAG: ATP-binding protein [Oscillospiraceae bacterium]